MAEGNRPQLPRSMQVVVAATYVLGYFFPGPRSDFGGHDDDCTGTTSSSTEERPVMGAPASMTPSHINFDPDDASSDCNGTSVNFAAEKWLFGREDCGVDIVVTSSNSTIPEPATGVRTTFFDCVGTTVKQIFENDNRGYIQSFFDFLGTLQQAGIDHSCLWQYVEKAVSSIPTPLYHPLWNLLCLLYMVIRRKCSLLAAAVYETCLPIRDYILRDSKAMVAKKQAQDELDEANRKITRYVATIDEHKNHKRHKDRQLARQARLHEDSTKIQQLEINALRQQLDAKDDESTKLSKQKHHQTPELEQAKETEKRLKKELKEQTKAHSKTVKHLEQALRAARQDFQKKQDEFEAFQQWCKDNHEQDAEAEAEKQDEDDIIGDEGDKSSDDDSGSTAEEPNLPHEKSESDAFEPATSMNGESEAEEEPNSASHLPENEHLSSNNEPLSNEPLRASNSDAVITLNDKATKLDDDERDSSETQETPPPTVPAATHEDDEDDLYSDPRPSSQRAAYHDRPLSSAVPAPFPEPTPRPAYLPPNPQGSDNLFTGPQLSPPVAPRTLVQVGDVFTEEGEHYCVGPSGELVHLVDEVVPDGQAGAAATTVADELPAASNASTENESHGDTTTSPPTAGEETPGAADTPLRDEDDDAATTAAAIPSASSVPGGERTRRSLLPTGRRDRHARRPLARAARNRQLILQRSRSTVVAPTLPASEMQDVATTVAAEPTIDGDDCEKMEEDALAPVGAEYGMDVDDEEMAEDDMQGIAPTDAAVLMPDEPIEEMLDFSEEYEDETMDESESEAEQMSDDSQQSLEEPQLPQTTEELEAFSDQDQDEWVPSPFSPFSTGPPRYRSGDIGPTPSAVPSYGSAGYGNAPAHYGAPNPYATLGSAASYNPGAPGSAYTRARPAASYNPGAPGSGFTMIGRDTPYNPRAPPGWRPTYPQGGVGNGAAFQPGPPASESASSSPESSGPPSPRLPSPQTKAQDDTLTIASRIAESARATYAANEQARIARQEQARRSHDGLINVNAPTAPTVADRNGSSPSLPSPTEADVHAPLSATGTPATNVLTHAEAVAAASRMAGLQAQSSSVQRTTSPESNEAEEVDSDDGFQITTETPSGDSGADAVPTASRQLIATTEEDEDDWLPPPQSSPPADFSLNLATSQGDMADGCPPEEPQERPKLVPKSRRPRANAAAPSLPEPRPSEPLPVTNNGDADMSNGIETTRQVGDIYQRDDSRWFRVGTYGDEQVPTATYSNGQWLGILTTDNGQPESLVPLREGDLAMDEGVEKVLLRNGTMHPSGASQIGQLYKHGANDEDWYEVTAQGPRLVGARAVGPTFWKTYSLVDGEKDGKLVKEEGVTAVINGVWNVFRRNHRGVLAPFPISSEDDEPQQEKDGEQKKKNTDDRENV